MIARQEFNPNALTLKEIFSHASYMVPSYQRNYAWEAPEIEQLVQDIFDQCNKRNVENRYYLGSLVVNWRNNRYEIIDGQQRYTTLAIIVAVLKNIFQETCGNYEQLNLTFESRPSSQQSLEYLYTFGQASNFSNIEPSLAQAFSVIHKKLVQLCKKEDSEDSIGRFAHYFFNNTIIVRSPVPQDTDLNHYFEIMNTRGVQLEKHEVLKARLLDKLSIEKRSIFAQVWDACADMDKYVQLNFEAHIRVALFGVNLSKSAYEFNRFCELEELITSSTENHIQSNATKNKDKNNQDTSKNSHEELLRTGSTNLEEIFSSAVGRTNQTKPQSNQNQEEIENSERFSAIINFPNFLLQTLKLFKKGGDDEHSIPLDDKHLLEIFKDQLSDNEIENFIIYLLKARMVLDKFVIKLENDKDWSLKQVVRYTSSKSATTDFKFSFSSKNLSEGDDELDTSTKSITDHILQLLSMLHVSFPSQNYKHWLNGVLCKLLELQKEPTAQEYLDLLETYNDRLFFGQFGKPQLSYHEINFSGTSPNSSIETEQFNKGTNVHNYIFNRLDYAIWKACAADKDDVFSYNKNARKIPTISSKFRFSNRNSVEHYYPQNPFNKNQENYETDRLKNVDRFGNLCLISHSKNSTLGNRLPSEKRDHYPTIPKSSVESLKQQIMLSFEKWDSSCNDQIARHEMEMQNLLIAPGTPISTPDTSTAAAD